MIAKLRRRFIRIVMEAFCAVLLLLLLGVNLGNRSGVYAGIDERLRFLAESSLGPPEGMLATTPPETRRWVELNSAGLMSESSYFIITGYMTPPVRAEALSMLSAATAEDAASLLSDILAVTDTFGNVGSYRYYAAARGAGYKVVFLRCEQEFTSMRSLLLTSVLAGFACLLLVSTLVMLLSEKAMRPFAQNVESQKRFISNAGHELKTPLGVIMSDLDMQILETGPTEWLSNAQLQADHLAILIEQLTAYSLLDEKIHDADAVPVDLSALAEAVLADFRPLALSKAQTLRADIAPDIFVRGNGDAFRTLLSVLMDNAVKYTPAGGSICLRVRQDRRAVIETENACDDFDEAELSHLFERFYRAPRHRAAQNGTGLGLSIAYDIVSYYKGSIRASGADGSITFTAELPL